MNKRTLIGAAAFSIALAGGGAAGALLGTPGVSGAQDTTSTTAPSTSTDATPDAAKPHRPHPRLEALEAAAEAIGITPAELRTELQAGKSIAQVAEEKGVDKQKVVDAIVADGTERLQKAIDELPTRAGELVDREGLPERPDGPGPGRGHGPRPDGAPEDAPADAPAADATS